MLGFIAKSIHHGRSFSFSIGLGVDSKLVLFGGLERHGLGSLLSGANPNLTVDVSSVTNLQAASLLGANIPQKLHSAYDGAALPVLTRSS